MLAAVRPLDRTASRKTTIGLILTWPEVKNAEYEVIQRLATAARNLDYDVIVTDNDGYILWSTRAGDPRRTKRIGRQDCDFVISLHFESPRLFDAYSYAALWNPLDFYFMFGYEQSTAKLVSHNDCVSCRSDIADAHALSLFESLGRPIATPIPALFHSLPEPYLEPRIDSSARCFYVGINWERTQHAKGRHHDVLKILDEEDLVHLYGPEEFLGVKPWAGFKNYKGSISFDGRSILSRINEAGICLALSSAAHQRSGIMSNRLFEGFAGGAVVIANRHSFVDRFFPDCVYTVDDSVGPVEFADQIRAIVQEIRRDPEAAREKVHLGQERLRQTFSLEACLERIVAEHPERIARFERQALGTVRQAVTVIAEFTGHAMEDFEVQAGNLLRQKGVDLTVILICDGAFAELYRVDIEALLRPCAGHVTVLSERFYDPAESFDRDPRRRAGSGPLVLHALRQVRTDFVALLREEDEWFADHLASLAHALRANPGSLVASSGSIAESRGPKGRPMRRLTDLRLDAVDDLLHARRATGGGRFLYRRAVLDDLPEPVFTLLDGQEQNALNVSGLLRGPISATNYATCVLKEDTAETRPKPIVPIEQQHQFVRDAFSGRADWRNRLAHAGKPPEFVFAYSPGAGIAIDNFRSPINATAILEPDRLYEVSAGGDGTKFVGRGFSRPEHDHTWIEGDRGELDFRFEAPAGELALVLILAGLPTGADRIQHVTVSLNGFPLGYVRVTETPTRVSLLLDPKLYRGVAMFRLVLEVEDAVIPPGREPPEPRRLGARILRFGIVRSDRPRIEIGRTYAVTKGADGVPLLGSGFSHPEEGGTWIDGRHGEITFSVPVEDDPLDLLITVLGRKGTSHEGPKVDVQVNGDVVTSFRTAERFETRRVTLDPGLLRSVQVTTVALLVDQAEPVRDEEGRIIDPRHLGLAVSSIGLAPAELPRLDLGRTQHLGDGDEAKAFLLSGFSRQEKGFTWIEGHRGRIGFALPGTGEPMTLAMRVRARAPDLTGPQEVTVSANGRLLAVERLQEGDDVIRVPLDRALLGGARAVILEIGITYAKPVRYPGGQIGDGDPRPLGLAIVSLILEPSRRAA